MNFYNALMGYQPDERLVYNDGYSSSNATLFEGMSLPGVTDPATVFKHARFHYAQLKLRPERYTLNVDWENLICTRGDLVHRLAGQHPGQLPQQGGLDGQGGGSGLGGRAGIAALDAVGQGAQRFGQLEQHRQGR